MKVKINKDNLIKILISLDIIVIIIILELMLIEQIPQNEENKVKIANYSTNEEENNILDNKINNILVENMNIEDSNTVNKKEESENTNDNKEEKSTVKKANNNTKSTNSNINKEENSNKTSNNNKNNSTNTSKPEKKPEKEENKPSEDKDVNSGTFYQSESKTMFNDLNEFRKENGKKALSYSNSLENYAKIRAKEIAENFSHTRPGRRYYFRCFFRLW